MTKVTPAPRKKITTEDAVLALKAIGLRMSAVGIAAYIGDTDSRAVATAMRNAVKDGRVVIAYRGNIGWYRLRRLKAKKP